jgi:hypothetical protein
MPKNLVFAKTIKFWKLDDICIYIFLSSILFQISCPFRGIVKMSFLATVVLLVSTLVMPATAFLAWSQRN